MNQSEQYAMGKRAFHRGVTRLGSHAVPCALLYCRRPACRGYNAEMRTWEGIHERHVDLLASCPLCRAEAGDQPDRLVQDEVTE